MSHQQRMSREKRYPNSRIHLTLDKNIPVQECRGELKPSTSEPEPEPEIDITPQRIASIPALERLESFGFYRRLVPERPLSMLDLPKPNEPRPNRPWDDWSLFPEAWPIEVREEIRREATANLSTSRTEGLDDWTVSEHCDAPRPATKSAPPDSPHSSPPEVNEEGKKEARTEEEKEDDVFELVDHADATYSSYNSQADHVHKYAPDLGRETNGNPDANTNTQTKYQWARKHVWWAAKKIKRIGQKTRGN